MTLQWGDGLALAAALGWATTTVLARHISKSIPALWYNALRVVVASVLLLALLPWTAGRSDLSAASWTSIALLLTSVITGFALGDTAFFESMRRLGVARAAPIAGCHPLVTALLAVPVLGEPVTAMLVVGILIISAGVWLITTDRAATPVMVGLRGGVLVGAGLALGAAVGWSISTVIVRPALDEIDAVLASTIRMPFAAVVLTLAATRAGAIDSRKLVLTPALVGWLALSGVLTLAGATLFLWAVEVAGAARTAALTSVSPIFSATIAVLLLGERITARLALGMGVTVAGVVGILASR